MKPFEVADQRYDKAAIEEQRKLMIELRDAALKKGMMDWAVILSHQVGILAHVGRELTE